MPPHFPINLMIETAGWVTTATLLGSTNNVFRDHCDGCRGLHHQGLFSAADARGGAGAGIEGWSSGVGSEVSNFWECFLKMINDLFSDAC